MDGLIKGLVNVALDHLQPGADDNDNDDRTHPTDHRSRSTWAEVTAGDPDADLDHHHTTDQRRYGNHEPSGSTWAQVASGGPDTDGDHRRTAYQHGGNHDWESRPRPPSQTIHQQVEDNSDGWETVGKKPSRHKLPKDQWSNYKCSPDDQHYSSDVDYGSKTEPSEEELSNLSNAANKLWDLDFNRLVPGKDYEIACGEGKKVYQKDDVAEECLFSWVAEDVFTRRPTYSRFCALLDNYNPHEGYREKVTEEEISEQRAFIEEISRTPPIKYLHKYLATNRAVSESYGDFKQMLSHLWFDLYNRGGTSGSSSAFEHVFVGEIKRGEQEVSGFHNWIQFYLEEAKGNVDYQGYIFPRRRGQTPDSETQLLTIQFEWNGILKSVSSTLVGVSPEFEIALYTLCFYMGGEDNHVQLGPYQVNIKCYRHGDRLGSAFPIADS